MTEEQTIRAKALEFALAIGRTKEFNAIISDAEWIENWLNRAGKDESDD